MKKPLQSFTGQAARRLRGLKHQLAGLQRAARRAAVAGCIAASTLGISSAVFGQLGQTPMAASGGIANRAVQGLRGFSFNNQGRLYYGINAADRGLGYRGSYMTLGGYFPTVEDDLGGLWAADVRSHLSNYGGFFSNIGAVRKQLLGSGSLLGVGVYWDYDGDQNQYDDQLIGTIDSVLFPGGFSYNQVGISGELLTDWGNLRSNGYIPLGSTGQSTGRFASTNILCLQGINAALGGADLEVGAYLPGLADWSGMINVGGYAYGNTRYQLDTGAELVPWFGGVFTRIDLTFAQNWDFSLQYNNDSYFDSTGFARLTYRLGGSRRRNVPDQMEQPMMRNEHIVRAHQQPVIALRPDGQPWRVIHVDNSAAGSLQTGSSSNPVLALGGAAPSAESLATADGDIIFVRTSGIPYSNATVTAPNMFTFQESNQYLIGEGSSQTIPTLNCGPLLVSSTINTAIYPTLMPQPNDTAIDIPAAVTGATVSGFQINSSGTGLTGQSTSGVNTLGDLTFNGGLNGIEITAPVPPDGSADYSTYNLRFLGQSGTGLLNNGAGTTTIENTTFKGVSGTALETNNGTVAGSSLTITDTAGSGIIVGGTNQAGLTLTDSTIANSGQSGILASGDGAVTTNNVTISGSIQNGVRTATGSTGSIQLLATTIDGETLSGGRSGEGILMEGATTITLDRSTIATTATGIDVTGNAILSMTGGSIVDTLNDGVRLRPTAPVNANDGSAILTSVTMGTIGGNGISTEGVSGQGGDVSFISSSMSGVNGVGILGTGIGSPGNGASIRVSGFSLIANTGTGGIQVTDSNLRVESSTLTNNEGFGVNSIDASTVLVENTLITGTTDTGIQATARENLSFTGGSPTNLFNDLTATNNIISIETNGIVLQGGIVSQEIAGQETMVSQGVVRANINRNTINNATSPITLSTSNGIVGTGGATPLPPDVIGGLVTSSGRPQGIRIDATSRLNLQTVNGGAAVEETPNPLDPEAVTTPVDYDLTTVVTQPPQ